jgi:uncharacterized Zn finger protein
VLAPANAKSTAAVIVPGSGAVSAPDNWPYVRPACWSGVPGPGLRLPPCRSGWISLVAWFEDADLRRLAGGVSYGRGVGYVEAISELDELPDGVLATVHGTGAYQVRLYDRDGALTGSCTCPIGQDGAFCKHCVAVGLALLTDGPHDRPDRDSRPERSSRPRLKLDLSAYLRSVDPEELVELLLEAAADDPAVHRRLSLRAATAGDLDLGELRRRVDSLRRRGFLDYAASYSYAAKAADVLAALGKVAAGHPEAAGPLYRRALVHITKASEEADDSSGVIAAAAAEAVDGYATACRAAPPDPPELARWLIDFHLDGPGWPEIDIADFAPALGPDGLGTYRAYLAELAESAGPSRADRWDHRTFTIRHLREGYLRTVDRDTDALVALYAEELPAAYQYVRIAETLLGDDRAGEAITWLERGLRDAHQTDHRIHALLAEQYTAAARYAEALDLLWRMFTARPDTGTHRDLLDAAERAGTLAETGDRALAHLRQLAARGGYHADPLVTILLSTGDTDAAWAAVQEHGCGPGTRFTLAQQRAANHPADAIPIYADAVEAAIDRKNRGAYAEAARLLTDLKNLHRRAGTDFTSYLAELTTTHRRKTTLLTELARAGL